MIQKIKAKLMVVASLLVLSAPVGLAVGASAQVTTNDIKEGLCGGTTFQIDNPQDCPEGAGPDSFEEKLQTAVNILSAIIGVIAVIMIIWAGFRYMTSGGAQEKVKTAKDTLLYAIIGLIIVALAQIIVRFVINTTD